MTRAAGRTATVAAGVALAALVAVPALAAWQVPSEGASGASRAGTLGAVSVVGSSATESSVSFSWSPGAGVAPADYVVTAGDRTVCSGSSAACTVSGLSAGTTYTYDVQPRLQAWTGPATTVRVTTSPPAKADPRFVVEHVGATSPAVGSAATYRVTATNGTTAEATYSGAKTLTFSGLSTSAGGTGATATSPLYPTTAVVFTAGVATVTASSFAAGPQTLTVREGTRTGAAPPVTWVATGPYTTGWAGCAPIDRFAVLSITVSRGTDAYGNAAPTTSAVSYTLNNKTGNSSGNPATIAIGSTTSNVVTIDPSNDKGPDELVGTIVSPVPGYPATWTCTYAKS